MSITAMRQPAARKLGTNRNNGNGKLNPDELNILRNSMLFTISCHSWGNRAQADKKLVSVNANKGDINVTKRLLRCDELEAVMKVIQGTYDWCVARSMGSRVRKGFYFVKRTLTAVSAEPVSQIEIFDEFLREQQVKLEKAVEKFIAVYPKAKLNAQKQPLFDEKNPNKLIGGGLGDLYDEADYPSDDEMRSLFYFEWQWLALSVPNELPEEIRVRENAKLRDQYLKAQSEMKQMLREYVLEMVQGAVDQLVVKEGEKEKRFNQNQFDERWSEFFATFDSKNIIEDTDLSAAVNRLRAILGNGKVTGQEMKKDDEVRERVGSEFAKVKERVAKMVEEKPKRRFAIDD